MKIKKRIYSFATVFFVAFCSVFISSCVKPVLTYDSGQPAGKAIAYRVIRCRTDFKGKVVIPDTYRGKPVTGIDSSAFDNCTEIKDIKIGKNINFNLYWLFFINRH